MRNNSLSDKQKIPQSSLEKGNLAQGCHWTLHFHYFIDIFPKLSQTEGMPLQLDTLKHLIGNTAEFALGVSVFISAYPPKFCILE